MTKSRINEIPLNPTAYFNNYADKSKTEILSPPPFIK